MKKKQSKVRFAGWFFAVFALILASGCGNDESIVQTGTTDIFTQDLNPPFLDILWVVDNRSGMKDAHVHLVTESKKFFTRLDAATSAYRMAFVTADMQVKPAQIYPASGPFGKATAGETPEARASFFGDIVANSLDVNLKTGATDMGFKSAYSVLVDPGKFPPRANVPLVIVMISDADDASDDATGVDAVDLYEQRLLALKGGDRSLVRVYSINYKPLPPGIAPNTSASLPHRCATPFNADADNAAKFQDRYFKLAARFATGITNPELATADLCKPFASNIDISGLRLRELPKRFPLSRTPQLDSLNVTVVRKSTGEIFPLTFTYASATNEIVFLEAPPEGTNVIITYHTN